MRDLTFTAKSNIPIKISLYIFRALTGFSYKIDMNIIQMNASPTYMKEEPGKLICNNCKTERTPLWRKGPYDTYICNACGLYYKIHKKNRPSHFRTNTYKHRNRGKGNFSMYDHENITFNAFMKGNLENQFSHSNRFINREDVGPKYIDDFHFDSIFDRTLDRNIGKNKYKSYESSKNQNEDMAKRKQTTDRMRYSSEMENEKYESVNSNGAGRFKRTEYPSISDCEYKYIGGNYVNNYPSHSNGRTTTNFATLGYRNQRSDKYKQRDNNLIKFPEIRVVADAKAPTMVLNPEELEVAEALARFSEYTKSCHK